MLLKRQVSLENPRIIKIHQIEFYISVAEYKQGAELIFKKRKVLKRKVASERETSVQRRGFTPQRAEKLPASP
jgi:hypothetical protein